MKLLIYSGDYSTLGNQSIEMLNELHSYQVSWLEFLREISIETLVISCSYTICSFPKQHNLTLVFVDPMKLPLTSEAGIVAEQQKKGIRQQYG